MPPNKTAHLNELVKILQSVVEKLLREKSENIALDAPVAALTTIHEYNNRMNVTALEKFNEAGYVSAVHFYLNDKSMTEHKAAGAVVLLVNQTEIESTLKLFGHKVDEEDDEACRNALSESCKTIAERFKQALSAEGYPPLIASIPLSARNSISSGIEFSFDQYEKYEIGFSVKGKRNIVVELTMTVLKK